MSRALFKFTHTHETIQSLTRLTHGKEPSLNTSPQWRLRCPAFHQRAMASRSQKPPTGLFISKKFQKRCIGCVPAPSPAQTLVPRRPHTNSSGLSEDATGKPMECRLRPTMSTSGVRKPYACRCSKSNPIGRGMTREAASPDGTSAEDALRKTNEHTCAAECFRDLRAAPPPTPLGPPLYLS